MSENVEEVVYVKDEVGRFEPFRKKGVLCCISSMVFLLLVIIIFLLYSMESCSPVTENIICKKPGCYHTAAKIMSSIDFSQEPCENFYNYACGKMVSETDDSLDIFAPKYLMGKDKPQFLKKFRRFYESCITHDDKFDYATRVRNAKTVLERVGTISLSKKGIQYFNITEFIANMILFDSMPLFQVGVDVNNDDSRYSLKFMLPDQTSIGLGHWSSLSESKRKCLREVESVPYGKILNLTVLYNTFLYCQKNYADYLDSISTSLLELDFFPNMTDNDKYAYINDIRMYIEDDILSKFDEIPLPPNLQELNIKRQYRPTKVVNLQKKFPMIEWEALFKILTGKGITNETIIQLYNKNYFEDVFRELSGSQTGSLNNAFMAILANSLYESTVLPSHRHSREDFCKQQSKDLMPDIVNYIYKVIVKPEVIKGRNQIIKQMFEELKSRFVESLQLQEWLNDETKSSLIEKLEDLELVLFEIDDLDSEKKYLESAYGPLDILKGEYLNNRFDLMEFRRKQFFALHGENSTPENMFRHFVNPAQKEPYFFYPGNIICVPFGMFKHIREDLPEYLMRARLGFPLAKVIGYAFDKIGMHYGVNLTQDMRKIYKGFAEKTRDMIVQLQPVSLGKKRLFFNLNNDLSESDRIADNTAMKLISNSFPSFNNSELLPMIPSEFTKQKLFFLHLVQGLCHKMKLSDFMVEAYESPVLPPHLRVANMLGNSKEFSDVFGCKPDSGMTSIGERLQFPYLS